MKRESDKVIEHLGLVAGMFDELQLKKTIDSLIPSGKKRISHGLSVKIMVLNMLGFTGEPMYLAADFFENTPIDLLIKPDIKLSDINDDQLGDTLDAIYAAGPESLFNILAIKAAKICKVDLGKGAYGDTSSRVLFGDFDTVEGEPDLVKYGHSKDKRSDLKQVMLSLVTTVDGNFPLIGGIIPGNTSDTTLFPQLVHELKEMLKKHADEVNALFMMTMDTKLYTKDNIQECKDSTWLSRVSESIKEAKQAIAFARKQKLTPVNDKYSLISIISNYGGIQQIWAIVRSQEAYEKKLHTIDKAAKKEKKEIESAIKKLNAQDCSNGKGFSCEFDAAKALNKVLKQSKYHSVSKKEIIKHETYLRAGKPRQNDPKQTTYSIALELQEDTDKIMDAAENGSFFVLATNNLEATPIDMLYSYKGLGTIEPNFSLWKSPIFMCSGVYLKKQSRIKALGAIMLIGILIYAAVQYKLRKILKETNETLPNQLKKPTQKPTTQWVFRQFRKVVVNVKDSTNNLNETLKKILGLLGVHYQRMYCLPEL